jgi:hypothetical protein
MLRTLPISYAQACKFIDKEHRHHKAPQGHKVSIAALQDDKIVGVVVFGRPVARGFDTLGTIAEVTRLCTDGTKNVCSFLYRAAWRTAKEMGYEQVITYTLAEESGASLRAAGWILVGRITGKSWDTRSRRRTDKHPTTDKNLWMCGRSDPTNARPILSQFDLLKEESVTFKTVDGQTYCLCQGCNQWFPSKRKHAKTCSSACRKARSRAGQQ